MQATNTPQAIATRAWRRASAAPSARAADFCASCIMISDRPVHDRRPQFNDRDRIEEDRERREHEAERDRAIAPAATLLFGQHDSFGLFVHHLSKQRLDQQNGEQQEEVENGEREQAAPRAVRRGAFALAPDVEGQQQEDDAEHAGGETVGEAREAKERRRDAERRKDEAVNEDLL